MDFENAGTTLKIKLDFRVFGVFDVYIAVSNISMRFSVIFSIYMNILKDIISFVFCYPLCEVSLLFVLKLVFRK